MKKIKSTLNYLRIHFILILLITFSKLYSQSRFLWFGNENSRHQTARVYLKNGTLLSGYANLDRVKKKRIREITIGRTSEWSLYDNQKSNKQLTSFTIINLEGRKICPFETDSIVINSLTGIPHDSLWLFKIIDGKISAYNTRPSKRSKEFTHIQKEESEIYRYTREQLEKFLKDNEYAFSLFTSNRYKDGRSTVLVEYRPRRAILEYNFQTVTKSNKVDELLSLLKEEKNIEKKISYCKEIVLIDSSIGEPYLHLGDYAVKMNKTDEAYSHYTSYLRYCVSEVKLRNVREKIKKLQKTPLY